MYTALKYYTTISVFLLIVLLLNSTNTKAQEYNRQSDSLALVSLYNAANGPDWNNNTGWLVPDVPINQWYGVTVSGNRVTQINLSNNNLSGSIPAQIADLSNLTSLNISANQLQTDLPSLTRLSLLNSFNCSNNYLNFSNLYSSGIFSSFMIYKPQKITFAISSVLSGNTTSLSVNCPGPSLTYQWYETTNTSTNYTQYGKAISNSNSSSIQLTPEYSFHYYCKITCSYYPELIFYTDLVFVPTPFAATDRDALMDIYNNCGGSNWQNKANWGTANDISTWEGVTMTNGRVSALNLSNRGLTGVLPSGISQLTKLANLYLQSNQLEALADLSALTSLNTFWVSGNRLTFGGLAACNIVPGGISSFSYGSQNYTPVAQGVTGSSDIRLSVKGDHPGNTYQWYRENTILEGATDSVYSFTPDMTYSYHCVVKNNPYTALTLTSNTVTVSTPFAATDSLALMAIHQAVGGPSDWGTKPMSSGWTGVGLTRGRVTSLSLSSKGLVGEIPAELGNLTELTSLSMYGNQLTGLPNEIGNLKKLTSLSIYNNKLTALPDGIGDLEKLATLSVYSNQLTTFPESIGNLKSLTSLRAENNQIASLPNSFGGLSSLTTLYLTGNKLSGVLPSSISQLTKLVTLDLQSNQLEALADLSALTSLNTFWVSGNRLTFGGLAACKKVPSDFAYAYNFSYGSQNYTPVAQGVTNASDIVLSVKGDHPGNTYQWYREGSVLEGATDSVYGFTPEMTYSYHCVVKNNPYTALTLTSNTVTVSTPFAATDSLALMAIHQAVGGPSDWGTKPMSSGWTGVGLTRGRVTSISLSSRGLAGAIPDSIAYLTELTSLNLAYNQLNSLPETIGQLTKLATIEIQSNKLSSLPEGIGSLSALTTLRADNNLLTALPNTLGGLANLRSLNVSNNSLVVLPNEIAQLSLLNTLNVRYNQLETLPSLKNELPLLTSFNISYNNLKFSAIAASGFIGGNSGFTYSPQNLLEAPELVRDNNMVSLTVSDPHANDVYKWFRTNTEITGQNANVYTYESLSPAVYYATFTNTLYPGLILRTSTVNDEPDVVLIVNKPPHACEPATVNLTLPQVTEGSSANLSFTYWTNQEATVALSNPASVAMAGTYYIKATSSLGSSVVKPVVVEIFATPELFVIQPGEVCEPNTIDLTLLIDDGTSNGLTFTYWSDYQTNIPVENYMAIDLPGTYYIKGTTNEGCSAAKPVLVSIAPKPAVGLTVEVFPTGTVCSGEEVFFSANALNGGDQPEFIWYLNGNVLSNENEENFSSALLQTGDVIKAGMVSGAYCAGSDTVFSEPISMSVSSLYSVLITIEAEPAGLVCANTSIEFTATPSLSSETDQCYWLKNGAAIPGAVGLSYSASNLVNDDLISARYHSGLACVVNSIVESTAIEAQILPLQEVQVALTASDNIICTGDEVTFTATPTNGGTNPTYRWFNNGTEIPGETASVYTTTQLAEGNNISVELTSSEACVLSQTANSSVVSLTVHPHLAITGHSTTPATLYGLADGSITISGISGGSGGNIGLVLNDAIQTDKLILPYTSSPLAAGTHNLVLTDALGCNSEPFEFTITQPATFNFTASVTQHESAPGAADGIILIETIDAGQTLSFEYTINNGANWYPIAPGGTITGLAAGTYTIVLRADGVESQPLELTIEQTCSSYTVIIDNLTDCGDTQGTVKASGLDPDKEYQYILIPKSQLTKPVITLLGDNTVTIPLGSTYTDAGASANDPNFGDITADIETSSTVNTAIAGTYTVSYNVSNLAGLSADEQVRTVIVGTAATFSLTVTNGTGGGTYAPGTQVEITANPPAEGYQFKEWTGDVAYLTDATASTTNVTMPAGAVSVDATYEVSVDPDAMIMTFSIPSDAYTLTIPFFNATGYDCVIDWGDGSAPSTITTYDDADRIHVYATAGTYDVTITGIMIGIYFNNTGNKLQLTQIKQWGNVGMTSLVGAFYGCSNLVGVLPEFPSSVTSIGSSAFFGCSGLTSITIPSSVTSTGVSALSGCTGLTSITIPSSVTSIGGSTFAGCTGLTSITIPNSVTSIENSTFNGCTGLTSVTIPSSVTSIGSSAFVDCTGLTSVTIPSSVTSIGNFAFNSCTGLTSITIPDSVTSIGSSVFKHCTGLTSITIPSSVTSIGNECFRYCSNAALVVWIDSETPATLGGSSVFDNTHADMRIKVPSAAVTTYQAATYWSEYATKIISQ